MRLLYMLLHYFKLFFILLIVLSITFLLSPLIDIDTLLEFVIKHYFGLCCLYGLFIVIANFAIDAILDRGHDTDAYGERYEKLVAKKLRKMLGGKPLRSVLIPTSKGTTTEADILIVTRKGVFCIECKYHWSYYAYNNVSITDKTWRYGNETATNPFSQNNYHIRHLRQFLSDNNIPVYSIVASTARLENVWDEDGKAHYTTKENKYQCVFNTGLYLRITKRTKRKIPKSVWDLPNVLTLSQIDQITEKLETLCGNKQQRHEHAVRVQWEYIKNLLPDMEVHLIKDRKTGKIITPLKTSAKQQIKILKHCRWKKYVMLNIKYLSVEYQDTYTVKAMLKHSRNPQYVYQNKDIRQVQAHIKDAYITGYNVLTYKEAMKHPVFKQHHAISGRTQDETYPYFLCNIEHVQVPPEKYMLYLPELKEMY